MVYGSRGYSIHFIKVFVRCLDSFTCYNAVIGSWQLAFNWEQNVDFEIRDVKARVMSDSAWVTMKAYLNMGSGNVTNVFEFHNGRWYTVHHHCSVMLIHGGRTTSCAVDRIEQGNNCEED
ncbi:hypothetical protein HAX54_008942 [Datura stramonium]|uniref:SnoaL-like domain-containing protein n=1 Tax=Datura stramonium TaxID=4076 RepID=A0ABS8RVP2_DATST|nr:hypothetical protein [Datura stramonium]